MQNQLASLLDILVALFLVAQLPRLPDMDGPNLKYRFWWTMWIVHLIQIIFFPAHVMIGVRMIVATKKMLFSHVFDTFKLKVLTIQTQNRSTFLEICIYF